MHLPRTVAGSPHPITIEEAQCLAAQQGAVDWFDFWLNGREDPDPAKAEQYERWRELRRLQSLQETPAPRSRNEPAGSGRL
jgi:hypothetical protein